MRVHRLRKSVITRALALGEPRVCTLRTREPSCRIPSPHESLSPYNTRPPLRSISRFLRINTSPPWEYAHPVLVDEWLRHPREPTGTRHPFAPLLRKKIFPRSNRSYCRRSYSAYSDFYEERCLSQFEKNKIFKIKLFIIE